MIIGIHQPQYLPWVGYFDKIDRSDVFVLLDNVQFKKNEWQNRNKIRTKTGWQWLTVPVFHDFGQKINDVLINKKVPWGKKHLKALTINYNRAPYFDKYIDFLKHTYSQDWLRLVDVNVYFIKNILTFLGIKKDIYFASELSIKSSNTARIIDICKKLNADTYLSGQGGREYLDEGQFSKNRVKLVYHDFAHLEYQQCYRPFIPYMSIIDLLFNHGENSLEVLRNTRSAGITL